MGLPYLYFVKGEKTKAGTSYIIVTKSYIIHSTKNKHQTKEQLLNN